MGSRKRWPAWLCAGVLVVLLGGRAQADAVEQPSTPGAEAQRVVQETTDAVIATLSDPELSQAEKRRKVETLAYTRFDFATIARLVLARNWRRMSEQQREEFVHEFKRHLSLTYSGALDGYKNETIEYVGSRLESNGDVTVRSRIVGASAEPIPLNYRVRAKEASWYVIDVIVEGVSLISNFRSQTKEVIGEVGPQGLIERLREKNAERDREARAGSSLLA